LIRFLVFLDKHCLHLVIEESDYGVYYCYVTSECLIWTRRI